MDACKPKASTTSLSTLGGSKKGMQDPWVQPNFPSLLFLPLLTAKENQCYRKRDFSDP